MRPSKPGSGSSKSPDVPRPRVPPRGAHQLYRDGVGPTHRAAPRGGYCIELRDRRLAVYEWRSDGFGELVGHDVMNPQGLLVFVRLGEVAELHPEWNLPKPKLVNWVPRDR